MNTIFCPHAVVAFGHYAADGALRDAGKLLRVIPRQSSPMCVTEATTQQQTSRPCILAPASQGKVEAKGFARPTGRRRSCAAPSGAKRRKPRQREDIKKVQLLENMLHLADLVVMAGSLTPVPIPNTAVKYPSANGTLS